MNCKKLWSREVIEGCCTKSFRDQTFKKHRENILFEREKCLFPATQETVVQKMKEREYDQKIKELNEKIAKLQHSVYMLQREKSAIMTNTTSTTERKEFIKKCPVENCKGFLSTQWNCDLCKNKICSNCSEIKGEEHVCLEANVETTALLKKDTKSCPSCGQLIFKISGCDQMWCPGCHVAFNWKTGKIETGAVHNPHYYEFQRQNGTLTRVQGDVPCGGLPSHAELFGFMRSSVLKYENRQLLENIHRLVEHVRAIEIKNINENNLDIRVKFMMNEIDEGNFKLTLHKREKHREKTRDKNNVLTMFCDVTQDYLRQLMTKQIQVDEFFKTMETLRDYTNTSLETVNKRYGSKARLFINDRWITWR
jgi:hypothetical protein